MSCLRIIFSCINYYFCSKIFVSFSSPTPSSFFFFFNDPATPEIYTLSLHDALPICFEPVANFGERLARPIIGREDFNNQIRGHLRKAGGSGIREAFPANETNVRRSYGIRRSEEHTSELQSPDHLVCRLLLEKKNTTF